MKSGRQRREEIKAQRKRGNAKRNSPQAKLRQAARPVGNVPVNEQALAPYTSYGAPAFAVRGYYQDIAFRCRGCGQEEIWTANATEVVV